VPPVINRQATQHVFAVPIARAREEVLEKIFEGLQYGIFRFIAASAETFLSA
jgi:hypothetical protein